MVELHSAGDRRAPERAGKRRLGSTACGDDDTTDDIVEEWAYDTDENALAYELLSMNPGYTRWQAWERDERGRTVAWSGYDSVLDQRVEQAYSYRGNLLDLLTTTYRGPGAFWGGPFTTLYLYQPIE